MEKGCQFPQSSRKAIPCRRFLYAVFRSPITHTPSMLGGITKIPVFKPLRKEQADETVHVSEIQGQREPRFKTVGLHADSQVIASPPRSRVVGNTHCALLHVRQPLAASGAGHYQLRA